MMSNKKFRALKAKFQAMDVAIATARAAQAAVNAAWAARCAADRRRVDSLNEAAARARAPGELEARHEAWLEEMATHRRVFGPAALA